MSANEKLIRERVVDVFKEGRGTEKLISIEVDGKRIGSLHLGSSRSVGNPNRVVINITPTFYGANYHIGEVRHTYGKNGEVRIILLQNS